MRTIIPYLKVNAEESILEKSFEISHGEKDIFAKNVGYRGMLEVEIDGKGYVPVPSIHYFTLEPGTHTLNIRNRSVNEDTVIEIQTI